MPSARTTVCAELRSRKIAANVHYIPVHLHPFYRDRFGTGPGLCPEAEKAHQEILSIPIFPDMTDAHVDRVISCLSEILKTL